MPDCDTQFRQAMSGCGAWRGPRGELILCDVCKIALLRRFHRLPREFAMPATMERNDG
jgi:hypothetical protein